MYGSWEDAFGEGVHSYPVTEYWTAHKLPVGWLVGLDLHCYKAPNGPVALVFSMELYQNKKNKQSVVGQISEPSKA